MKRLLKFETFVPKNLEKRQEELKRLQEKEKRDLKELANKMQEIVKTFKDVVVEDRAEEWFVDQFAAAKIKTDNVEFPHKIYFFNRDDKYLGNYDFKDGYFWLSFPNIWSYFLLEYGYLYDQIKELTQRWIEKHFKLEQIKIIHDSGNTSPQVEQHFKHIQQ